jgi:uncharacterized repeat protein (TIGR02543 family)
MFNVQCSMNQQGAIAMKKLITLSIILSTLFFASVFLACDDGLNPGRISQTISFDSRGGSEVSSVTAQRGSTLSAPSAPQKRGYDFDGWFVDANGETEWDFLTDTVSGDMTLFARWSVTTFSITFSNLADGENPNDITEYTIYSDIVFLPPTRAGFIGAWNTPAISAGSVGNLVVTAVWVLVNNSLTISFNIEANGGTGTVPEDLTDVRFQMPYGTLPTDAEFSLHGHSFAGWFTAPTGGTIVTSTTPVNIPTDHTLYARFNPRTLQLSFIANGGSSVSARFVVFNTPYGTLTAPTRTGFVFNGWFLQNGNVGGVWGDEVTEETVVSALNDHTLFARWTERTDIVLSFDILTNGATGTAPASRNLTFNAPYGELPDDTGFSRVGHVFDGWFTTASSGGTRITETTVVSRIEHTLFARWIPLTGIIVSFDIETNGGVGITPANLLPRTFNSAYGTLPVATNFGLAGHKFAGWFTAPTGGTQVTSSTLVLNASNHTLFAQFNTEPLLVSFNSNSGSSVSAVQVDIDGVYGILPSPVRTGFVFAGWFLLNGVSNGIWGSPVTATTLVTATNDHTLFARWTARTDIIVSFDILTNGATGTTPANVMRTFNAPYGPLPTTSLFSKTGYVFLGWFTTAVTGGSRITDTSTVQNASNHTLFARWNEIPATGEQFRFTLNEDGTGYEVAIAHGAILTGIVTIPDTFEGLPVVAIATNGFRDNHHSNTFARTRQVTSFIIPDTVTELKINAFRDCIALTTLILPPALEIIGDYAFDSLFALRNLVIPPTVTHIGDSAFQSTVLTSIVIPASVETVGKFLFWANRTVIVRVEHEEQPEAWNENWHFTAGTDQNPTNPVTIIWAS